MLYAVQGVPERYDCTCIALELLQVYFKRLCWRPAARGSLCGAVWVPPSGLLCVVDVVLYVEGGIRVGCRCFRHIGDIGLNSPVVASARYACLRTCVALRLPASTFLLPLLFYCSPGVGILLRKQCSCECNTHGALHALPVSAADTPPSLLFSTAARAHSRVAARSVLLARSNARTVSP